MSMINKEVSDFSVQAYQNGAYILIDGVQADNQIGITSCMYESADQ